MIAVAPLEIAIAALDRRLRENEKRAQECDGAVNELRETIKLLHVLGESDRLVAQAKP